MSCCTDYIIDHTLALYALEDIQEESFREVSSTRDMEFLEKRRDQLRLEYPNWVWKITSFHDAIYDITEKVLTDLHQETLAQQKEQEAARRGPRSFWKFWFWEL